MTREEAIEILVVLRGRTALDDRGDFRPVCTSREMEAIETIVLST